MNLMRVVHEERELKRARALLRPLSESHLNPPTGYLNKSRFSSGNQTESEFLSAIAAEHPRLKRLFDDWRTANSKSSNLLLDSSCSQLTSNDSSPLAFSRELNGEFSSQSDILPLEKTSNSQTISSGSVSFARSTSETASRKDSSSSACVCPLKYSAEELNKMRKSLNPLQFQVTQLKHTER